MESSSPTCLITGTSQGIGQALAGVAAESGATVVSLGRTDRSTHPSVIEREVDIRNPDHVAQVIAELPVDRIDILINNAGVFLDPDQGIETLNLDHVVDTFQVNAAGAVRVTRGALPLLLRSPAPRVLNISSVMGSLVTPRQPGSYAYRMSKAALNMFTVALATEFPRLRVFSIHPGHVRTKMGGSHAPVEPETSAKGIWRLAQTPPPDGLFFDYEGRPLDW